MIEICSELGPKLNLINAIYRLEGKTTLARMRKYRVSCPDCIPIHWLELISIGWLTKLANKIEYRNIAWWVDEWQWFYFTRTKESIRSMLTKELLRPLQTKGATKGLFGIVPLECAHVPTINLMWIIYFLLYLNESGSFRTQNSKL